MKKRIKTILKIFLAIVWMAVVFTGVSFLDKEATKDYTYQGKDLTFNISSRNIEILSTDAVVQIEGASQDYFQLKKEDKILYSTPIKPPLDYDYDTYFTLSKSQISEGKWEILNDESVTFILKSDKPVSVIFHNNGNSNFLLSVILIAIMVFVLGFWAIDNFIDKKFVIKVN